MEFGPAMILNSLVGFALFAIQITVAVVALTKWADCRPHLRPAAIVAGVVVLLTLPANVVSLVYLEPGAAFASTDLPAGLADLMVWFIRLATIIGVGLNVCLLLTQLPVATLLGAPDPFPLLGRRANAGVGVGLGLGGGLFLGLVSALLFWALEVDPSQLIEMAKEMLPGVDTESPIYLLSVSLPAVLGIALSEELLFRGIIQRWLHTKLDGRSGSSWLAIGLTSLLWASAHLANVEQAGLKVAQIFLIGLFFGHLTKRYSVEASMVAHVALNFVAVVAAVGLKFLGAD